MKKVMILGAGIYQVPLIKEAKRQGLYTIVVSRPGNYPGFCLADKCYYLDTTDEDAILKAAREEQIDSICTAGTDVAVRALGHVCDTLGLHGLPYAAAVNVTDKYRMKEAFAKGGVSSARFFRAESLSQAKDIWREMQKNGASFAMVKAVDSSGSRGVTKIASDKELESAYQEARKVTRHPYVLLEEFIDGHEIGVDGFILDGRIVLMLPHEKFVLRTGGTTIPRGHGFPYTCAPELELEIRRQMELAIRAVGLDNTAFNADVLVKDSRVWILEIGGRTGATGIPELISMYCGFSYYEKVLQCALGKKPDFTPTREVPCMSRLLFSPVEGTITDIKAEELEALKKEGVALSLDFETGDTVSAVHCGADRIGQFLVKACSDEVLFEITERIYRCICINGTLLSRLWKA